MAFGGEMLPSFAGAHADKTETLIADSGNTSPLRSTALLAALINTYPPWNVHVPWHPEVVGRQNLSGKLGSEPSAR